MLSKGLATICSLSLSLVLGWEGCGSKGSSSEAPEPGPTTDPVAAPTPVADTEPAAAEAKPGPVPPWTRPVDPPMEGVAGAAQALYRGQTEVALQRLGALTLEPGSGDWFVAGAVEGRAHLEAGNPEAAMKALEARLEHADFDARMPGDVIGLELSRARFETAKGLPRAEKQALLERTVASLKLLIRRKTNRYKAPMTVLEARARAAMPGKDDKDGKRRASVAVRALDKVLAAYPNHPAIGDLQLERARALARAGRPQESAMAFRQIAITRAGEPEADLAWNELGALAEASPRVTRAPWTNRDRLDRALHARSLRRMAASRVLLDEVLAQSDLPRNVRYEALHSRGYTSYRQRDFDTCAADLSEVYARNKTAKIRDELVRCLDRGERYDEVIEFWLARANTTTGGAQGHAQWNAIRHAVLAGRYEQASDLLTQYETKHAGHNAERDFLHAWLSYRLGEVDTAVAAFSKLERRKKYTNMSRYFRGKLLLHHGEQARVVEGVELLRTVVRAGYDSIGTHGLFPGYPAYYGLMARARLIEAGVEVDDPPELKPMPEVDAVGYATARDRFETTIRDFASLSPALVRADQLHAFGYGKEARRELRWAADEWLNGKGGGGSNPRTEGLVAGLGWAAEWSHPKANPGGALRSALRDAARAEAYRVALRGLTAAIDEPHRLAKLSLSATWPYRSRWQLRAYRETVEREAARRGFEPSHLWALMYTESRFRRHVVSYVGARGAVQIMPNTGRYLEERLDEFEGRFDGDTLFDIDRNVYLAAFYVAELLTKFQGQAPMAYASYNGGPNNVGRWVRAKSASKQGLALDEWVEEIDFNETHKYTRRVMAVQATYQLLYTGKLPVWSNVINPTVEGNIEF